jgi:hypothetical protein
VTITRNVWTANNGPPNVPAALPVRISSFLTTEDQITPAMGGYLFKPLLDNNRVLVWREDNANAMQNRLLLDISELLVDDGPSNKIKHNTGWLSYGGVGHYFFSMMTGRVCGINDDGEIRIHDYLGNVRRTKLFTGDSW